MRKITLVYLCLFACKTSLNDSFDSSELISSKGEKVYINSLNWGVTGDYQISRISKKPSWVKNRGDTIGVIKGLEPFTYIIRNDSLKLFFYGEIAYRVKEHFNAINVS